MTNAELMTNEQTTFSGQTAVDVSPSFVIKKVPPPTPDRREGRLFPPEQSWKTLTVLNDLLAGSNKFYRKYSHMRQQREIVSGSDLRRLASRFLVFHA